MRPVSVDRRANGAAKVSVRGCPVCADINPLDSAGGVHSVVFEIPYGSGVIGHCTLVCGLDFAIDLSEHIIRKLMESSSERSEPPESTEGV